jgi:hypothetical protein
LRLLIQATGHNTKLSDRFLARPRQGFSHLTGTDNIPDDAGGSNWCCFKVGSSGNGLPWLAVAKKINASSSSAVHQSWVLNRHQTTALSSSEGDYTSWSPALQ